MKENEDITYQDLWDAAITVFTVIIAINTY